MTTDDKLMRSVGEKEKLKLHSRRHGKRSVWFGFGMFGLIGWSVVIPTLVGALTGLWIDRHHPGRHSWTLALLVAGLMLGLFNAWHWVSREEESIREEQEENENE